MKVALQELKDFIVVVSTGQRKIDMSEALIFFQGWVDQALLEVTSMVFNEGGMDATQYVRVMSRHLGIDSTTGAVASADAQAELERLAQQTSDLHTGVHVTGGRVKDGGGSGRVKDGAAVKKKEDMYNDDDGAVRKAHLLASLEALDASHATISSPQSTSQPRSASSSSSAPPPPSPSSLVLPPPPSPSPTASTPQQQDISSFIRAYAAEQQAASPNASADTNNTNNPTDKHIVNSSSTHHGSKADRDGHDDDDDDDDVYIPPSDLPPGVQAPFSAKLAKVIMFTARRCVCSRGLEPKLRQLRSTDFQFMDGNHPLHKYYLYVKELERDKMLRSSSGGGGGGSSGGGAKGGDKASGHRAVVGERADTAVPTIIAKKVAPRPPTADASPEVRVKVKDIIPEVRVKDIIPEVKVKDVSPGADQGKPGDGNGGSESVTDSVTDKGGKKEFKPKIRMIGNVRKLGAGGGGGVQPSSNSKSKGGSSGGSSGGTGESLESLLAMMELS